MPSGTPLTPEQVERASEVFAKTGNYSAAGRAIGVGPNVARDAILRHENANRRKLHGVACEEGLRQGREALIRRTAQLDRILSDETKKGESLDAADFAALTRASCQVQQTIALTAEHEHKRRLARLTRERAREEIELLRARRLALLDFDELLMNATDEERDTLRAISVAIRKRTTKADPR